MTTFRVTASNLNVRALPSADAQVIGFLARGDVVEGHAVSDDGYWYEVERGSTRGWCAHKYLSAVGPVPSSEFAWMAIAAAEQGIGELPGPQSHPRIVEYLHSTSLGAELAGDEETPWCSAFVNWCLERAGYAGTDSAWARSWLRWGVELAVPTPGCIAVFRRGATGGHVAFYVGETATHIRVLGGNQSNRVTVAAYPRERLLGYRGPGA